MNKIYSISIVCFLLFTSNNSIAQDTIQSKLKGWSTELNFNPFDGSLSLNNANAQIKIRKFSPNGNAVRIAFTLGYKSITDKLDNVYGSSPISSSDQKQYFQLAVNIGTEKHFRSSRRLSPYIGWEAGLGFKVSKEEMKINSSTRTIKGAWETRELYYAGQGYYYNTDYVERGFISVGAKVLTGFDFYMAKDFYFGYEIGFGLDYTKYSKIIVTRDSSFPDQANYPDYTGSSWDIGPRLVNGIRIGFIF
jgi:hypothetical protein